MSVLLVFAPQSDFSQLTECFLSLLWMVLKEWQKLETYLYEFLLALRPDLRL
jgi:hypothetical protein